MTTKDAMTLNQLSSLPEGALLRWRGEIVTLVEVAPYRGQTVVWVQEINGPLLPDAWAELELEPAALPNLP